MITLPMLWRGRGQHRAADRIPALEAELKATQDRLANADTLIRTQFNRILEVGAENTALRQAHEHLAADLNKVEARLDTVTEGHSLLLADYDELAARYTETAKDLRDLRAITAPGKVPPRPTYDPDATAENVMPLWDATGRPTFAAA